MTIAELITLIRDYDFDLQVRIEGTYPDTSPDLGIVGARLTKDYFDVPCLMLELE